MNPKVSIIIVNYNSEEVIGRCIESIIYHVSAVSYEIIVVDNASSDDSVHFIKKNFPQVRLILNSRNEGFGAANNRGAQQAKGKYLFFLNPDTLLLDNAVLCFYHFLEKEQPDAGAVGGNLVKENGIPTTSFGNFPSFLQEWSDVGFRRFYPEYYDKNLRIGKACPASGKPVKVPYITGADIFIRKEVFQEVEGFDEQFFLYYEETDLFYRLHRRGYTAYLLPEVKIVHLEGPALLKDGRFNYEKWAFWEKSKYYYFRKNHGKWVAGLVKANQLFSLVLHRLFGEKVYRLKETLKITWNA